MSDSELEATINALVEALHDQELAQEQLDSFKADHRSPKPPEEFINVRTLIEFHRERRWYEEELAKREERVADAKERYAEADEALRDVLPENVPLHYDYAGRRLGLGGKQYNIVKREGRVIVTSVFGPSAP
jgi:hypothetical protein